MWNYHLLCKCGFFPTPIKRLDLPTLSRTSQRGISKNKTLHYSLSSPYRTFSLDLHYQSFALSRPLFSWYGYPESSLNLYFSAECYHVQLEYATRTKFLYRQSVWKTKHYVNVAEGLWYHISKTESLNPSCFCVKFWHLFGIITAYCAAKARNLFAKVTAGSCSNIFENCAWAVMANFLSLHMQYEPAKTICQIKTLYSSLNRWRTFTVQTYLYIRPN